LPLHDIPEGSITNKIHSHTLQIVKFKLHKTQLYLSMLNLTNPNAVNTFKGKISKEPMRPGHYL